MFGGDTYRRRQEGLIVRIESLAVAIVAQAAVDYITAKGEDWQTAEAFLKSECCRWIVEMCGADYRWPCEGLEKFR
jgi:hypothetical protein